MEIQNLAGNTVDLTDDEKAATIRSYQKQSASGYLGVTVEKYKSGNRFRARHMGRNLGTFDTAKEAALAYALADIEHKKDDEEEEAEEEEDVEVEEDSRAGRKRKRSEVDVASPADSKTAKTTALPTPNPNPAMEGLRRW